MAYTRLSPSGKTTAQPYPRGYHGDSTKQRTCSASLMSHYRKRRSGLLIDCVDIHVEVPRLEHEKLSNDRLRETSAVIRQRVKKARDLQRRRVAEAPPFAKTAPPTEERHVLPPACNSDMWPTEVRRYPQTDDGRTLLKTEVQHTHPSAREYHRVLKVARTIADPTGSVASIHCLPERHLIQKLRLML